MPHQDVGKRQSRGGIGAGQSDEELFPTQASHIAPGRCIRCALSGGVAAYPGSGTSMEDLFHAVDVSAYEAKNADRNLVRLHKPPTTIPVVVTR